MTMRRAVVMALAGVMLAGCPSTMRNRPAPDRDAVVGDVAVSDVGDDGGAVDADVADADVADVGDVRSDDADVGDVDVADVHDGGNVGDAGDVPGMRMTIEFSSAALSGQSDSGVQMRANITWHGALRGDAGGITFEGEIR